MKLKAGQVDGHIDAFVRKPPAAFHVALLYGPDRGLVRERADTLLRSVAGDLQDPFRLVTLPADAIASDPARLADEAAAIAFGGGRRGIRVPDAGDAIADAVQAVLDDPKGDTLVVLQADLLPKGSRLRRAVEKAPNAAAMPCFADEGRRLGDVIASTLREAALPADPDALAFLADHLGSDRNLTRRELEKLVLYCGGPDSGGRVDLAAAMASVGDSAALTLADLCRAAASGELRLADRCLVRLVREGVGASTVIRALGNHLLSIEQFRALLRKNLPPKAAGDRMRLYGPKLDAMRRQAALWTDGVLADGIRLLTAAEARTRMTELPEDTIASRCVLSIGLMARRAAGRR